MLKVFLLNFLVEINFKTNKKIITSSAESATVRHWQETGLAIRRPQRTGATEMPSLLSPTAKSGPAGC